jgi:hypothetical protein
MKQEKLQIVELLKTVFKIEPELDFGLLIRGLFRRVDIENISDKEVVELLTNYLAELREPINE